MNTFPPGGKRDDAYTADSFQVSYAIGVANPLSVSIFHYGTSQKSEKELLEIVSKNFDLRPGVIVRYPAEFLSYKHASTHNWSSCTLFLCVRDLDLRKPIYQDTAAYGHFGRGVFSWEVPKELKF